MRPSRLLIGLLVGLVAALAVGPRFAIAEEGEVGSTETIEVKLQPGSNVVGWVGEALPAQRLFNLIRNLEAAYAWDAAKGQWLAAYPDGREPRTLLQFTRPRSLPSPGDTGFRRALTAVEPGMGLVLQIGGDSSVMWERNGIPARGGIELRTGYNLVSWQGLDKTLLTEAVRGLGSPFESIFVQTATAANRWKFYDGSTLQKPSTTFRLSRGDAVWVKVTRPAIWLQPTGLLPKIRFVGGEKVVHDRIQADVEASLRFFREQYALEPDATQYWVYAAVDQESLIDALLTDRSHVKFPPLYWEGRNASFGWVRGSWSSSAAWVHGGLLVVKQHQWSDPSYYRDIGTRGKKMWEGHRTMVHELTHVVQKQISSLFSVLGTDYFNNSGYYDSMSPGWLIEGTARYVEDQQAAEEGHVALETAAEQSRAEVADKPSLKGITGSLIYPLGRAASHFVHQLSDEHAWLDVFREMASIEFGANKQWIATPSWRRAFSTVLGFSPEQFFVGFETWRGDSATPGNRITGRFVLVSNDGEDRGDVPGAENIRMTLSGPHRVQGRSPVVWPDESGGFAFLNLPNGRYSFWADFGGGCTVRYPQMKSQGFREIAIDDNDHTGIRIEISDHTCAYVVAGSLLRADGVPLANVQVSLRSRGGASSTSHTTSEGAFVMTAPEPGLYRVSAQLDGCTIYYQRSGAISSYGEATEVEVANSDVTDITLQLAEGMCELRISGTLLSADDTPRSGQWVNADGNAGNGGAQTAADGSFSFAVPASGSFRLYVHVDGCLIMLGSRGATNDWNSAEQITVSNADVTGLEFRLPEDPATFCSGRESAASSSEASTGSTTRVGESTDTKEVAGTRVAGRLLDHQGNGIANERVYARLGSGEQADTRTLADGTFELRIELAGQYRLDVWPGGCRHFYRSDGGIATSWGDATVIQVSDSDVTGLEFRLPENPSTFCN